ncbi:FtsX-like permease family protein [Clostridium sp. YIM B02569]|uniref:FtsX-like permease family protein n=1 Tax=Clostridium sp. YIM B02569 TaxID=2911967 RepID=UPI001EEBD45D|nr:FtsX-like permease family protein [Clostridium sp. YIM B02569]
MRYLRKQIYYNIIKNKSYIIVLFLISLLASFMYFFVEISIDANITKVNYYNQKQKLEDFRFTANDSDISSLEHTFNFTSEKRYIKKILSNNNYNYFFINNPKKINIPFLINGALPIKKDEIAVFPQFLNFNNLHIGDNYTIDSKNYLIVGTISLPDYCAFIPYKELQQNYNTSTFVLTTEDSYNSVNGQEYIYYSGKFNNPDSDINNIISKMYLDSRFTYLEDSNSISSDSSLKSALSSNYILAETFLIILTLISMFIYYMFFKKFLSLNREDFGCYKALGFTNLSITVIIIKFFIILSSIGLILGFIFGYFGSSILINLYKTSYSFPTFIKGISFSSLINGIFTFNIAISIVIYYSIISFIKIDTSLLLNNTDTNQKNIRIRSFANKISKLMPSKFRISSRIILTKIASLLLSFISILITSTLFITSYSLNQSSEKIISYETLGRNYLYDINYEKNQYKTQNLDDSNDYYLSSNIKLLLNSNSILSEKLIGLDSNPKLFNIFNKKNEKIPLSDNNDFIINQSLSILYGLKKGDKITFKLNNENHTCIISDVCINGDFDSIYVSRNILASWLKVPSGAYSGILTSNSSLTSDKNCAISTLDEKLQSLKNNAVSNKTSAILDQLLGIVIACLLIYLILLLNFHDNEHDIIILNLLGYKAKEIKRMLIDIYRPVFSVLFIISLPFSIIISEKIHKFISIETNDFIPFSTNILFIIFTFIIINLIYSVVVLLFNRKVRKIIIENPLEYLN